MPKNLNVEIILKPDFLKENNLEKKYKKGLLSFEIRDGIPKEITDELNIFLNSEEVGPNQIIIFNPIIDALNQLQDLKDFKYEKELSNELHKEVIEKCQLEHLSYDLTEKKYLFDFKKLVSETRTKEQMDDLVLKTNKVIESYVIKQHKSSHQVYKNSKKIIGSFNSSLSKSKGIIKKPYLDISKKIESIYKFLKTESDNTKNSLDNNYKECLDLEEEKKKIAEEKKKAKELEEIKKLSAENEKQAEILKEQKKAQIFNSIKLGHIGNISKNIAGGCQGWNKEGLILKKEEISNLTLDIITKQNNTDYSILDKEQIEILKKELLTNKTYWNNLLDREIKLRDEKIEAEKNKAKVEVLTSQVPVLNNIEPTLSPFENQKVNEIETSFEDIILTEDDIVSKFCESLSRINDDLLESINLFSKVDFKEDFYKKISNTLSKDAAPKISDLISKTVNWVNSNQENYINHKKSNK